MSATSVEKTWTVVYFVDEDDAVEAVPTGWIQGELCYWPSWTRSKLTDAIKRNEQFNTCWPMHKVKLFRNATFDNYLSARLKAQKACHTSDLNSDEGSKRKVVQRKTFDSTDSEGDDLSILPLPPNIVLNTSLHNDKKQQKNTIKEKQFIPNVNSQAERIDDTTEVQKPCCCAEVKKSLEVMSNELNRKMTSIKASLFQLREDVNTKMLVNGNPPDAEEIENFFLKCNCPLKDLETLAEAEEYLKEQNHFKQAVKQIGKLGGRDGYEIIKRFFIATISDFLSKEFTFDGTKTKKPFKETMICSLFIAAADGDNKTVEMAIRKWLRRSTERNAYKNKK